MVSKSHTHLVHSADLSMSLKFLLICIVMKLEKLLVEQTSVQSAGGIFMVEPEV